MIPEPPVCGLTSSLCNPPRFLDRAKNTCVSRVQLVRFCEENNIKAGATDGSEGETQTFLHPPQTRPLHGEQPVHPIRALRGVAGASSQRWKLDSGCFVRTFNWEPAANWDTGPPQAGCSSLPAVCECVLCVFVFLSVCVCVCGGTPPSPATPPR